MMPGSRCAEERSQARGRSRRRPDVSGYFTVVLVCALASGLLVGADLIRLRVPLERSLSFALADPMTYLFAAFTALLAFLLVIGEV